METKAVQTDDRKIVDERIHARRQEFALTFTRYIALGSGSLAVSTFVVWLFFRESIQLLPSCAMLVNLSTWMALYPLFQRAGRSGLGSFLAIGALILSCIGLFIFLPEARLGAIGAFLASVLVANLILGQSGARWVILVSTLLLIAGILFTSLAPLAWTVPLNPSFGLVLNLIVTLVPFTVTAIMVSINISDQERYFSQSQCASLEIERRAALEHEQGERLRQANQEIERTAETERTQRKNLADVLTQVRQVASDLNGAASEILAAATQQATGATEQSTAITQATTTVEEIKVIAQQSEARAQEVANASQQALLSSNSGQKAVQETLESMNKIKDRVESIAENVLELSEKTQQIGEIISTVNSIAAQSNMLALNASVEAARAGEHGKGFAVVAGEVRALAEQSRAATGQVKGIIADIQKATNSTVMATEEGNKEVDQGQQCVLQARSAIETLGSAIHNNAQIATQVYTGGRQQQTGIEQIALAMHNINQATVQNLTGTRQTEKGAGLLTELARKLVEMVEKY